VACLGYVISKDQK